MPQLGKWIGQILHSEGDEIKCLHVIEEGNDDIVNDERDFEFWKVEVILCAWGGGGIGKDIT